MKTTMMLIDGALTPAADGGVLELMDPCTARPFALIARGTHVDVGRAVHAARKALDGPWRKTSATERGRLLQRLAQHIRDNADQLIGIEAQDTGKSLDAARADVEVVARYFEFYGTAADKLYGETIPFQDGYDVSVMRVPLGVTGHIIPWNYPAQMVGRSIAPALAMGNAVVVKPSEDACLSALKIGEFACELGFPDGVINIVTGLGHEAGAALAAHPGIDLISFTGSPGVGTQVQKAAAENHVPCVLELGGKSPQIVFEDADLDKAAPVIVKAITQNAGQTCSAGSRLLVHESVYEGMVSRITTLMNASQAGTPEMNLACGPLINAKQYQRVTQFIDAARDSGLPVVAQGRIADGVEPAGWFVPPIAFGPVSPDHRLAQEEIFGPVLAIIPFSDENEAVAVANGTEYGLVAGVWTRCAARQARMVRSLHCGQVFLNCYGAGGGVELPFGGVKRSGHGREKGLIALEEMSTTKTVIHHYAD